MNSHIAWLQTQIHTWVDEGLLDEKTAQAISDRYPSQNEKTGSISVLTAIGALIFGLGVILFFAFNWSHFSKSLKLFTIFTALLLSHGLALFIRVRAPTQVNLTEGLHLLGTMMFGAGIWLIAQMYHMDEHYPTAFLLWGSGALALAWAIPSVWQAMLACVLISVWGVSEVMDFRSLHTWSVILLAAGVLPLAWLERSVSLLTLSLMAVLGISLINAAEASDAVITFFLLFGVSTTLLAAAYGAKKTRFPESSATFIAIGTLLYGGCLFIFSMLPNFPHPERLTLLEPNNSPTWLLNTIWAVLIGASVFWAFLALFSTTSTRMIHPHPSSVAKIWRAQYVLLLVSLISVTTQAAGWVFTSTPFSPSWTAHSLLFNAILLLHCVLLIMHGTQTLRWKEIALACLTLGALIVIRFNDLFDSLLLRSLVFLALGVLLFVLGQVYTRRKAQLTTLAQTYPAAHTSSASQTTSTSLSSGDSNA